MKLILLAATAMLAMPAFAQDTTAPVGGAGMQPPVASTPTTADPAQTGDPATMPAPGATDATPTNPDAAPAPGRDAATGMTNQSRTAPGPTTGATPMGGYQPAQPPMNGTPAPGVAPTFQAAPSPTEAYPAPAPLAKYPVCKKGQYDKCMQRGGK